MTENAPPTDPDLIRFLREELGAALASGGSWDFTGPLWLWRGKAKDGTPTSTAWHFVTIDGAVGDAIRAASPGRSAAWGSVYVHVSIGDSHWQTSVFPSKEAGGYLLPIKAIVRKAQRLAEGDMVTLQISV